MRVIGTAGHVDHGKSTLVQALTGTHPDRLKEEQLREMTIDLGFAWLKLPEEDQLPDTEEIGIIDVPGHRDFIENMLAGVGGIDAALFVVAVDEGVMPQTREHLAILDLLQIEGGVVALTKVDLVDDPEWIDLVEDDLRRVLAGTVLEAAPILRVSGRTGQGISELIHALSQCLMESSPRPDLGRPRLPVDRVFTIAGFGTIVTGTLSDGSLYVGDEVIIYPRGLRGRVRGLQSHNQKTNAALPGGRTAVNVSGIDKNQIDRGDVISHPGSYQPTRRIDVQFRALKDMDTVIKHNTEVKVYIGAAEVLARLRLLGMEDLKPGETGWLQLELRSPVVVVRGDRYILRRPSPGLTLGGGAVVDPHPARRHKRFSQGVLSRLQTISEGTPKNVLIEAAQSLGAAPIRDLISRSHLDPEGVVAVLEDALADGDLLLLEDGPIDLQSERLIIARQDWNAARLKLIRAVEAYHTRHPLHRGMQKEELRSRTGLSPRLFGVFLQKLEIGEELLEEGPFVLIPGHKIRFSPSQQREVDRLLEQFAAQPFSPPTVKESIVKVGEDLYGAIVELGFIVPVSAEVVFHKAAYEEFRAEIQRRLQQQNTISVAQVRDQFHTSRRYALAFLEHLDDIGVTVREGDVRRLK
jgi:selenocysteine-specific elongation factor